MQIISFLYFEELIPKVTEYGFFFINIYLKQYAYQCLLKRKPNYTNLKVIQEYDTFFIIVTCLFSDEFYGYIKSDCSCWTSFSNFHRL